METLFRLRRKRRVWKRAQRGYFFDGEDFVYVVKVFIATLRLSEKKINSIPIKYSHFTLKF